jgi:hypothetical protein
MNRAQRKLRLEGVKVPRAQALEGLGDPATWTDDAAKLEQKTKAPYMAQPVKKAKPKTDRNSTVPVPAKTD